jgi:MHS family proline/betaine transporter-like MFS transporter
MHHPSFALMLAGQMGFAVLLGVFLWVGPAAMVEVFPARVRCSAYSVGYNLTLGFLGGCDTRWFCRKFSFGAPLGYDLLLR